MVTVVPTVGVKYPSLTAQLLQHLQPQARLVVVFVTDLLCLPLQYLMRVIVIIGGVILV